VSRITEGEKMRKWKYQNEKKVTPEVTIADLKEELIILSKKNVALSKSVIEMTKYKMGFVKLMEYYDQLDDNSKLELDEELKSIGL
jgi:hypothetical protein